MHRNNSFKLPKINGRIISKDTPRIFQRIAAIQHPGGKEKKIAAGFIASLDGTFISYNNIDTEDGSSGCPIVSASDGKLVGIHVKGGCSNTADGYNHAVNILNIKKASPIIRQLMR